MRIRRWGRLRHSPIARQLVPGLPTTPPPITLVPFISQITTAPLVFCHRMSE